MGVFGWNRLLAEGGWMPDTSPKSNQSCCSPSPWLDLLSLTNNKTNGSGISGGSASRLSERIVAIPPNSELCFDGYCLCFHLFSAAYAQHMDRVLYSKRNHHTRPCQQQKASSLTPQQVRHLLPMFLPLKVLADVTDDFCQTIARHNVTVKVYWDGPLRYGSSNSNSNETTKTVSFKQATDDDRQSKLDTEWATFQQYCLYGRMPSVRTICEWEQKLPKHRLFAAQVKQSLRSHSSGIVEMVECIEEADAVLARDVRGRRNAYVVGLDSDFCFFPDVNYIPMVTLDARSHNSISSCLTAVVIRRDALVEWLDLPDEESMVELAILMGNDYVDPVTADFVGDGLVPKADASFKKHNQSMHTSMLVEFLREKGSGYRVQSSVADVEEDLQFTRTLYGLGDMSKYALEESVHEHAITHTEDGDTDTTDLPCRPHLPDCVAADDFVKLSIMDRSVKDAVRRALQTYVDQAAVDDPTTMLSPEHLSAFDALVVDVRQGYKEIDKTIGWDPNWRPQWQDVFAVYMIERVIQQSIKQYPTSPVVLLSPPYSFFDQYKFHALLKIWRDQGTLGPPPLSPAGLGILPPADTVESREAEVVKPEVVERPVLPVDEFEDTILESVRTNRVTIIQGDTGCGKSSRIPIMLLRAPPPSPLTGKSRLFISQPRRIAAKALVERLRTVEPDLRDQIGLRMGHGVREYETTSTRAWFVTTGYLVRLMANHPERFDNVSYLIIDEVHERSVDTDILCLLCRRLLLTNPHIRLVLMSATLAAALYQEYFQVSEPTIRVGARRFPVEEVFLEDIAAKVKLPMKEKNNVSAMIKECYDMKCHRSPSANMMEKMYSVVAYLATVVGQPGSSVLVFVPGMGDIVAITELIELIYITGITFTCFPIHSDIPFDDQMQVFEKSRSDEVKIVIATNAAESSVTLPDVDHVICLGLCKQIVYNETSHRQMLMPTWISRASATQRAGRTGRLRPGTVYRMYVRETYEHHMDAFEPGEMLRIPLDSVILMLKQMLVDEEVTDVLLSCLEPPNISTIDRSFESLHNSHFITSADDQCEITMLGEFVSALGIDLALGSLIGLGVQFGVGAEAIQMAGVLSFPKTPFVMSNPLIHEAKDYNDKVAQTFAARCHFDAGVFSEPIAAMNLLWEYGNTPPNEKMRWCRQYGIFHPRIKRLDSTCLNLSRRVAEFLKLDSSLLEVQTPPVKMPHAKITILRVLQVWVFHETVIQFDPSTIPNSTSQNCHIVPLEKKSDFVSSKQFDNFFLKKRHPFTLLGQSEVRQKGMFQYRGDMCDEAESIFSDAFEPRFLSYLTEKKILVAWVEFSDYKAIFVSQNSDPTCDFDALMQSLDAIFESSVLIANQPAGKARKGRFERPCGLWTIKPCSDMLSCKERSDDVHWIKYDGMVKKKTFEPCKGLLRNLTTNTIRILLPWQRSIQNKGKMNLTFEISTRGDIKEISIVNLKDLFGSLEVKSSTENILGQQKLSFPYESCKRSENAKNLSIDSIMFDEGSSLERSLIECIPEAARLVSVLASGRRREHMIEFSPIQEEDEPMKVHLNSRQTKIGCRWKRYSTGQMVYVETNTVPSSAVPRFDSGILYCTCSNTLEVRGGLRAEGLTMLPPGKLFLLVARLSFGLYKQENLDDGSLIEKALSLVSGDIDNASRKKTTKRIKKALAFHLSSRELEERLECFPEKVAELVDLFDEIDGHECAVWDSLIDDPLTGENLKNHRGTRRRAKQIRQKENEIPLRQKPRICPQNEPESLARKVEIAEAHLILAATSHLDADGVDGSEPGTKQVLRKDKAKKSQKHNTAYKKIEFSSVADKELNSLFSSTLPAGEALGESDLPSGNILNIVVGQVRLAMQNAKTQGCMSITDTEWSVYEATVDSASWYTAVFSCEIPYTKRTSKNFPAWLKQPDASKARPSSLSAAVQCVPPEFANKVVSKSMPWQDGRNALFFGTIDQAIRMEASFWLERQFLTGKKHWYQQHDIPNMVGRLKSECSSVKKLKKKKKKKAVQSMK